MSFECKVCNKEYKSYQSLWNHKKKFHTGNREIKIIDTASLKYICKFCNKKFDTKQKASYHRKKCKNKMLLAKPKEPYLTSSDKLDSSTLLKNEPDFIETIKNIEEEINNKSIPPIKNIKKNINGIIYLIQPSELVGTNRYKIGMSKNPNLDRCKSYKLGSRYLCIMECTEPSILELNMKQEFKKIFSLIAGTEYFEGSEKLLLTKFIECTYKHINKENELIV